MKRISLCLGLVMLALSIKPAFAASYGDLYDVEWCPCDPENELSGQGSVILGQTVMCPCDYMYDGYGRTLKKDVQKVKEVARKVIDKASNYKYYIGIEYNKSEAETNEDKISFPKIQFINPVEVRSNNIFDDQDNIGIIIGTRPHPNFGIEAFYNRTFNESETIHVDQNALASSSFHVVNTYVSKYQAFGVDVIGYLPVTDFFDFVAFVGLGQYYFENDVTHQVADVSGGSGSGNPYFDTLKSNFDDDKLAWRIGGGLQVNIGRGVALRALYRYINLDSAYIKNLQEFSLGVKFVF